ncbi:hypothetical protein Gohar_000459 [Gossypium harknessii]|uniref:Uncharacterized protein n=1 Tax=Gossypium harknessii TaxID=34285 RepID=A0A7J9I288_9ROSI|nr:hypothetical protein [Gossypium harknessii]
MRRIYQSCLESTLVLCIFSIFNELLFYKNNILCI